MEVPFYYSFKEFEENYKTDLENWLKNYLDADEIDYKKELLSTYGLFLDVSGNKFIEDINSNWIPDEYPEYYELSIITYKDFMQEKLLQYLYNNGFSNFDGDYLEIPFDIDVMDFWEDCNLRTRKNSGIIDDKRHKYLKVFFSFDNFSEKLIFDDSKYRNFKYSVSKIFDYLIKNTPKQEIFHPYKIKLKGSLQSIGFIFSELIDKGYIEAPKRNGNNNTSAISRMILEHFEFIDKEEQPKPEDIRKTLFIENKLSADKQTLFKIPESKIINTD